MGLSALPGVLIQRGQLMSAVVSRATSETGNLCPYWRPVLWHAHACKPLPFPTDLWSSSSRGFPYLPMSIVYSVASVFSPIGIHPIAFFKIKTSESFQLVIVTSSLLL